MHAPEKSRNSTCSTDNGSSHGHEDNRLTYVTSNMSTISSTPKEKKIEQELSLSTADAHETRSPTASPTQQTSTSSTLSSAAAVHLNTLLTTGERKSWKFDPKDTVETVRTHIWQNWPSFWPQPKPESVAYLRLLHLGHILDNPETTLASRGCKAGATTVVHIIIRAIPPPPEPVKVEQESPVKSTPQARPPSRNREPEDTPGCCCVIC
ncbi:hypothetical protein PSEUBRA_006406 [Kalmanozyma brasiliensis GHG001]|uniref:UBL3-like ubiquitin domain-containing protein n=1 Tax=Kalmanozyma brasiliensis (strain GHG001) TaxID=1365824 RepID=V5E3A9_KALBG|nr:uncharacterized protein PSEUBRA_006406 [Kalmanozyma brasiliensis GHG001]EST04646.1 hypothetical protein PSEUBRA_006406 [Kalmanozyma brasiliensis GHG001]